MTTWWCESAWLDSPTDGVRVTEDGGRITAVEVGDPRPGDRRLTGLVLPGLADAHSHAFHRALRGRTHDDGGTFWTWRRQMYAVAARLDPDTYLALARATYAELALAGVTCVGEFSYLHHPAGGGRYADPNAMSEALVQAAADAGVRLTLLDTCYLSGGPDGAPLDDVQQRFSDGDADAWAARVAGLPERDGLRIGAAVHSVRAVPADQLATVAAAAAGRPLHVHVSEQPAENTATLAATGCTPTALLAEHGVLGPDTTAVHAVHLTDDDVATLAATGTGVCACPSTEADLADGIGPFRRLADAGVPLCLGSDQHVRGDLLGEAQALEATARLVSGERGRFTPAELVTALTAAGHRALGWPDAGRLAVGQRADLVAVRRDSVRTAGCAPGELPLVAAAADVTTVVVEGRVVVEDGRHVLGDVGALLAAAIGDLR
ncbi:formimidoylglutamate deiminase [Modestobacter altitudinis]|uniref:formimidoylglutamate deiminase n=1 Tax=Modestobacter altitudinis TaxID=2213158 RepID=UPI00110CD1AF|nr:formimidoylglutamate deiminase [Modestobacter altitudinis]